MDLLSREQQRQQYLGTMGITSWLPVRPLSGALPSPEWQWEKIELQTSGRSSNSQVDAGSSAIQQKSGQPSISVSNASIVKAVLAENSETSSVSAPPLSLTKASPVGFQAPTAAIHQLLSDDRATLSEVASVRPSAESEVGVSEEQEASSPAREPQSAVPRFRLAFVGYKDCLVINEMPIDVVQGFTAIHQALLDRILLSVGLGGGEPNIQLFAWPVVNSTHVDQGHSVARAGVKKMISRFQLAGSVPLFLLGEQAETYAMPERSSESIEGHGATLDRPVLAASSLNQLMRIPGQKRELWHQLLKLKITL